MISPRRVLLNLTVVSFAILLLAMPASAQRRNRGKAKAAPTTPASAPAPPTTLQGCGVSVTIPPGWQLTPKFVKPTESADPASASERSQNAESSTEKPETPEPEDGANGGTVPPRCSFVLAPRSPSELQRNRQTEGPVGRMELRVVDGDLDTAATQMFQKDEKGWYVNNPKDERSNATLAKPKKGVQVLSAVSVQRCVDRAGQFRGLCEVNRYVYSNGRRNLLVTAGPYLGETEFVILNSIRFAGSGIPSRKKR